MEEVKDMTQENLEEGQEVEGSEEESQGQEEQESNVNNKIDNILEQHGYENLDEMLEELTSSKDLREQVGNRDINKLLKAQEELDKIHAFWAEKEAERLEKNEMPDETIERLKKEKKELQKKFQKELTARDEAEESVKAIKKYNSEVNNTLISEGIKSEDEKEFVSKFFGVNNPFNEVDINNKVAVKKMVKQGLKDYQKFKEQIIQEYLDGKQKNPPMKKTDKASVSSSDGGVKSLKQAHKALLESLTKK